MAKFSLNIELGNDAMLTPSDVAGAIDRISEKLARRGDTFYYDEGGVVLDDNGNTVGKWEFVA